MTYDVLKDSKAYEEDNENEDVEDVENEDDNYDENDEYDNRLEEYTFSDNGWDVIHDISTSQTICDSQIEILSTEDLEEILNASADNDAPEILHEIYDYIIAQGIDISDMISGMSMEECKQNNKKDNLPPENKNESNKSFINSLTDYYRSINNGRINLDKIFSNLLLSKTNLSVAGLITEIANLYTEGIITFDIDYDRYIKKIFKDKKGNKYSLEDRFKTKRNTQHLFIKIAKGAYLFRSGRRSYNEGRLVFTMRGPNKVKAFVDLYNALGLLPTIKYSNILPRQNYDIISYNAGTSRPGMCNTNNNGLFQIVSETKDKLINYLDNWKASGNYLKSSGRPYKTSILLEGPRGTGKSTICSNLGSYLGMGTLYIDFSKNLDKQFSSIKPNTVVVMEEIDCAFGIREQQLIDLNQTNIAKSSIMSYDIKKEFGTFLNLLDGKYTYNNVVFIATTNYRNNLDEALLSRFYKIYKTTDVGEKEVIQICKNRHINYKHILPYIKLPITPRKLQYLLDEYEARKINYINTKLVEFFKYKKSKNLEKAGNANGK